MENGWNLFSGGRGQNGNCTNLAWDIWELGTSRYDWSTGATTSTHALFNPLATPATNAAAATASTSATHPGASEVHALMYANQGGNAHYHRPSSAAAALYVGGGAHYYPDPHLMCLKLGKRQYFEDATCPGERHVAEGLSVSKRGKQYYSGDGGGGSGVVPSTSVAVTVAIPATVPRCQVEGCYVALVNVKDYHRRHKVCEMHSKAPKVVVLGLEQRFCQQCSRFHVVSEFDDSKRSCRRRLAGHNERRRKSSHDHFVARNPSQENPLMAGRFPCISTPTGHALSLLSSPPDLSLSSRCSAALRELIAENRAAILARQFIVEDSNRHQNESSNALLPHQHQMFAGPNGWDRFDEAGTSVTLDLMQAPSSAFGLLSMSGKSREEEECSELWSSLGGTHVV